MVKKEGKKIHHEYLGFFVLAIGCAILFTSFSSNGITGFAVYANSIATYDGSPIDVVVGDQVTFSDSCGSAVCDPGCSGDASGTLTATGVNSNCVCNVYNTDCFTTKPVTLNISQNNCQPSESCSPSTNNLVITSGPGVSVNSGRDPSKDVGENQIHV